MSITWEQSARRTARSQAWKLVGAARLLQESGEVSTGEAFLILVCETAFLAGVAFALRKMAGEAISKNVLKPLYEKGFPYGTNEWTGDEIDESERDNDDQLER